MLKGQISIDLLFTLIAVVLIALSLNNFTQYAYKTHDNISLKMQLDLENERITNLITQTNLIDDLNYEIRTQINKINYLNSENKSVIDHPSISIQNNELILSINTGTEEIYSKKTFAKKSNTNINFSEEPKGIMVITHYE